MKTFWIECELSITPIGTVFWDKYWNFLDGKLYFIWQWPKYELHSDNDQNMSYILLFLNLCIVGQRKQSIKWI